MAATGVQPIIPGDRAFNLLDSIRGLPDDIPVNVWRAGISHDALSGKSAARGYATTCDIPVPDDPEDYLKPLNEAALTGPFYPFPIAAFAGCSQADINVQDYYTWSDLILKMDVSSEFAQEIALGDHSGSDCFVKNAVPVNTTADTVPAAIKRLQRAWTDYGFIGQAVFHCHTGMALDLANLVRIGPDNRLYLAGSTDIVIFDAYPAYTPTQNSVAGDSPSAPGDDEFYITMTSMVEFGIANYTQVPSEGEQRLNRKFVRAEERGIFRYDTSTALCALAEFVSIPTA